MGKWGSQVNYSRRFIVIDSLATSAFFSFCFFQTKIVVAQFFENIFTSVNAVIQ